MRASKANDLLPVGGKYGSSDGLKSTGSTVSTTRRQWRAPSHTVPRVHVNDPPGVHVNKVEDFVGHGVEARPRFHIVVVVVGDEDARGVHGKRPEAVQLHLLAHLQGGGHQHQPAAEPLGPDALHGPEALHVEEVLGVEEEHAPLGVKVIQHVLDPEGYVGVAGVVERRKYHRGVFVVLEHLVKGPAPFLQLLKPAEGMRTLGHRHHRR